MEQTVVDAVRALPLYTFAEAGRILRLSPSTIQNWATGYTYPTDGGLRESGPLITRRQPIGDKVLPFDGIAEAYVLSALRNAGVPMQRIRPAVDQLKAEMGLPRALLSRRLKTDGVEVLYDYLVHADPNFEPTSSLAAVHGPDRQLVFREAIQDYLTTITYGGGEAEIDAIRLPYYSEPVVIDPSINAGRPTIERTGVTVSVLADRRAAGESVAELADDFELTTDEVSSILADAV